MIVKNIKWDDEIGYGEADVIVTDGEYEVTCFSWYFKLKEGQHVVEPLNAYVVDYGIC